MHEDCSILLVLVHHRFMHGVCGWVCDFSVLVVGMKDAARLAAIRKLPCCKCGTTVGIQAAHSNFGEHGKGRGIKADDSYTIPLCQPCHVSFDQYKVMTKSESKQWFMLKLGVVDQALNGGWECPF